MELRTTEESLHELTIGYESIRRSSVLQQEGLILPEWTTTTTTTTKGNDVVGETTEEEVEMRIPEALDLELPQLAATLSKMQTSLQALHPKVARFRTRLAETDPVTGNPRYGATTHTRVSTLVHTYDFLVAHIPVTSDDDDDDNDNETGEQSNALTQLQQRHHEQQLAQEQARIEEERRRVQEEEETAQAEHAQGQRDDQRRRAEDAQRQQEQAAADSELSRQAEAARTRRLAQEQAEREWVTSIVKGPEGVKQQIGVLKESTATCDHPEEALGTALRALHTIFQQINKRPEETNFRRIRRDHEQFTHDIGRHKGGVELLIAAGFELGAIDDVPCYLSREPCLEKDMDGWSAWFDLLKATLGILEEQLPPKKR
jgi:hypothetical protein